MTKILIGVDDSERSEDAVAFGRALALAAGAPVIVAMAHRSSRFAPAPTPTRSVLREDAQVHARPSRRRTPQGPRHRAATSCHEHVAAHALQELAEQEDAGIIVVGSSHTGRLGRVLPGSTAERLLHGPVPGRRRAARLPSPRDALASGGRLRLPADPGRRRPRSAPRRISPSRCRPRCGSFRSSNRSRGSTTAARCR